MPKIVKHLKGTYLSRLAVFGILMLTLVACNSVPPGKSTDPAPSATVPSTPTATLLPSSTPTTRPPLVLFIVPPEANMEFKDSIQSLLAELSSQANIQFEVRPSLVATDLTSEVRLVVALPPDSDLAALAAAAPYTQFLAIGVPGLQPAANLTVLATQDNRPDQQGFIAGYIAASVTQDWRVAVISTGGTPSGLAARRGFINGAIFFCGLCRPSYPPFYQYPLYFELPAGASPADQQAAVDYLVNHGVQSVYIFPEAGDEALLKLLAQENLNLIGGMSPPSGLEERWIASIQPDSLAAIKKAWPDLLQGKGGASLATPLAIRNPNPALFSPGKQRLAETTLADLLAGFVDTGVDPLTGESR